MAQVTEHSPLLAPLRRTPASAPRTATVVATTATVVATTAAGDNNAAVRRGSSELGRPQQASFLGNSQTIRHRKKTRSQPTRHVVDDDSNSESCSDGDSESGSTDGDGATTDLAEQSKRAAADRYFQRGRSLSSASMDFGLLPQGLTKRKPRWSGLRNKLAAISSNKSHDVLPRVSGRRNRHRPANLRGGDGADGLYYYDAVVHDRSLRAPPTDTPKARIAAYCLCDQIALFKLLKWLDRPGRDAGAAESSAAASAEVVTTSVAGTTAPVAASRLHLAGWTNKMYMGVVHSTLRAAASDANASSTGDGTEPRDAPAQHRPPLQQKDAFYFATGSCVFWGLTREEEAMHLQALAPFSTGPVAQIEAEDMLFCYGDASRVANDEITLGSTAVAEKLAISFAMSQSAKLDVFEERVEDRIKNTKHIPSNLATTGSIQYTKTDISRLIGQLFIELADVNLHSEILDEPDFFWEDDAYEPLYARMVKYLDVNNRVKILNKRLDILRELVEVLNQELTRQHGTKLEWIIIWLLTVEIVIAVVWEMTVKDLLGYFRH